MDQKSFEERRLENEARQLELDHRSEEIDRSIAERDKVIAYLKQIDEARDAIEFQSYYGRIKREV